MIYDYRITTGKGEELKLADYKGKVVMVVNTATGCVKQKPIIKQLSGGKEQWHR